MAPLVETSETFLENRKHHPEEEEQEQKDGLNMSSNTVEAKDRDNAKMMCNDKSSNIATTPILVEIIGATNLTHPTNHNHKSKPMHPFVLAKFHGRGTTKILTKTKRIKNDSNPIWCVEHRCLFLVNVSEDMVSPESSQNDAATSSITKASSVLPCFIEFEVRNKNVNDPLSSSTHLCSSMMNIQELWDHCTNRPEERIELQLERQPQTLFLSREQTASSKDDYDPINNESSCTTTNAATSPSSTTSGRKVKSILKKGPRVSFQGSKFEVDDDEDEDLSGCKIAIRTRFASDLDVKLMDELKAMYRNGKYSSFHCDTQSFLNGVHYSDDDEDKDEDERQNGAKKKPTSPKSPKNEKVQFITERSQHSVGYSGVLNMFSTPFRNSFTDGNGVLKYKVKPYPDPSRKEETTYLSERELDKEIVKPSTNWVAAGKETSQSLGQVYLEILKCTDLPNMDTGGALGNKTDAFVCAIFEESMVQTDVIDDKLSPFWLPWTQRAFLFQITHASSPLFISVFDFDMGPGGHDGIGRIAVNLSHFKADTLYTLEYNIYPASNVTEREPLGSITIRLRKEIKDEKKLLLQSLQPAPRFHVNMKKRMSLPVAKYTCFGAHNNEEFDITLMRSYVNEMLELKRFLKYAINDSISSLVMWRGQVKVGKYFFPLHSATAFFGGMYIIERPHMIPGCFFLSIAWVMLASLNSRIEHPSPWERTLPFTHYLSLLIWGKSPLSHDEIRPMQCQRESCRFIENWETRIKTDLDAVNKKWELQLEMDKIGNEDLQTEEQKNSADPIEIAKAKMSPWLFPMQLRLRTYCGYLRGIKKVTTWEDGMLSFWITLPCIIIGIMLLILPTIFLIHWTCRLFIWICLGPWLRLYSELFIIEHNDPLHFDSNEKRNEYGEKLIQNITEQFQEIERVARMKGEDAMKMKSMRTIRFGQYIAKVPSTNTTRHYDFPVAQSKATHISNCPEYKLSSDVTVQVVPCQKLEGNMIPMTEEQMTIIDGKYKKISTQKEETANNNLVEQDDFSPKELSNPAVDNKRSDSNDDQDWLDHTLSQLTSLTFQGRTKVTLFSKNDSDDEEVKEKINIDDKVLHITAGTFMSTKQEEESCNTDDKSELSNLTDHDFDKEDLNEEEGLEVVAWEQAAVSVKVNGEDIDMNDECSQGTDSSLSAVYKSSDSVHMVFCRTPTNASKCDK